MVVKAGKMLDKTFSNVPKKSWVSRVEASKHKEGTAYVTFDNHRFDDNRPYVYVTNDYGKSWKNINRKSS